jgi:predicted TIM-barrel fold metal-dependent hydrolase
LFELQIEMSLRKMNTRRNFIKSAMLGGAAALAAPHLIKGAFAAENGTSINTSASLPSVAPSGIAPNKTIDWHNHWISPGVIEILKKRTTAPYATTDSNGNLAIISNNGPGTPRALQPGFTDIDLRLQHIDQVGVNHQVISWATTMGWDAILTADDAKPIWSAFNNDLSELVKKYPDKFSGYAVLPTSDINWSATELERAYTSLGLIGAVLPVGAFQSLEAANLLQPIFEVAQLHKGHIYLHSGPASPSIPGQITLHTPADDTPDTRYEFEWASTYARGATTLTQTDFLEPYPDVTVQIAMLGGFTPFLAAISEVTPPKNGAPDPIQRLRRVYLDSSTARAPHTLDLAVETIGADRILFGSDFPIATIDKSVVAVRGARISEKEKQQVFVETGSKLFEQKTGS